MKFIFQTVLTILTITLSNNQDSLKYKIMFTEIKGDPSIKPRLKWFIANSNNIMIYEYINSESELGDLELTVGI